MEILNYFTERTPGSYIEEREATVVWRFWCGRAKMQQIDSGLCDRLRRLRTIYLTGEQQSQVFEQIVYQISVPSTVNKEYIPDIYVVAR